MILPEDGNAAITAWGASPENAVAGVDAQPDSQIIGKSSLGPGEEFEPNVFCNIYDITPRLNGLLRRCCSGWGIYHTGVEVHGWEFAFGGHGQSTTGVWAGAPHAVSGAAFHAGVPVGRTGLTSVELHQKLAPLAAQWSGNSYDTLTRNCNHFTRDLCVELTGKPPPRRINRCAESSAVRCFFRCCLLPLSRCLERCRYRPAFVTYQEREVAEGEEPEEYCIKGARGMNQVLVEAATAQKARANEAFKAGQYHLAATMYTEALDLVRNMSRLDEDSPEDNEILSQARDVCKAILLNIAACNLKAEDWRRTVVCCDQVLAWAPTNAKALFRRGVARSHLREAEASLADLQGALSLTDAEDAGTRQHIQREIRRVERMR